MIDDPKTYRIKQKVSRNHMTIRFFQESTEFVFTTFEEDEDGNDCLLFAVKTIATSKWREVGPLLT